MTRACGRQESPFGGMVSFERGLALPPVEVHENSSCTAPWSKSVGAIEDCREFPSRVPQGRRLETSTHIEHRQAPSMQQEKQALTRQQQRRRGVNGCFVRYGGLEDDDMSHQVISVFVSCAPVAFFPMPSTITSCHLVSCKILLVVVVTRCRSTMTHQASTFAQHICAGHLGVLFLPDRRNRAPCEQSHNCNPSHQIAFASIFRNTRTRPSATHGCMSQPTPSKLLRAATAPASPTMLSTEILVL